MFLYFSYLIKCIFHKNSQHRQIRQSIICLIKWETHAACKWGNFKSFGICFRQLPERRDSSKPLRPAKNLRWESLTQRSRSEVSPKASKTVNRVPAKWYGWSKTRGAWGCPGMRHPQWESGREGGHGPSLHLVPRAIISAYCITSQCQRGTCLQFLTKTSPLSQESCSAFSLSLFSQGFYLDKV